MLFEKKRETEEHDLRKGLPTYVTDAERKIYFYFFCRIYKINHYQVVMRILQV